jgi:EmrB/QacA subfamily drug resistance transporter
MVTRGVGLRSERGPVLAAMMLCTALVAMDSTVIATAVPAIVTEIGGFTAFPWLFSVYLLAQAVSVPVYGKLSDLYGRKPVMLFGIGVFLAASLLCGAAWNIGALIAFRALQGLGAGAVAPTTSTIVGDLYSVAERAKAQAYIAGVWAVSSVAGPALGGILSEYASWRWIFLVNIPLCLLAAGMILTKFREQVEPRVRVIDYLGTALLTAGLTLAVLGVLEGGQAWAWGSPVSIAVLGGGALLLAVFVRVERRAPDPVLPLWMFRRRLLVATGLVSACAGAVLLGLSSYVPTFAQEALGTPPLIAGFALAGLLLGWPIAASQAGRIYLRLGFRGCALIGSIIAVAGAGTLLLLDADSGVVQVGASCFVIGLGMGTTASPTLIAAQASVGWHDRGVVTAGNLFMRSIGSSLGVAVFGAIANAELGPPAGGRVAPDLLAKAVHGVFAAIAVVTAVAVAAVVLLPRHRGKPE